MTEKRARVLLGTLGDLTQRVSVFFKVWADEQRARVGMSTDEAIAVFSAVLRGVSEGLNESNPRANKAADDIFAALSAKRDRRQRAGRIAEHAPTKTEATAGKLLRMPTGGDK